MLFTVGTYQHESTRLTGVCFFRPAVPCIPPGRARAGRLLGSQRTAHRRPSDVGSRPSPTRHASWPELAGGTVGLPATTRPWARLASSLCLRPRRPLASASRRAPFLLRPTSPTTRRSRRRRHHHRHRPTHTQPHLTPHHHPPHPQTLCRRRAAAGRTAARTRAASPAGPPPPASPSPPWPQTCGKGIAATTAASAAIRSAAMARRGSPTRSEDIGQAASPRRLPRRLPPRRRWAPTSSPIGTGCAASS